MILSLDISNSILGNFYLKYLKKVTANFSKYVNKHLILT